MASLLADKHKLTVTVLCTLLLLLLAFMGVYSWQHFAQEQKTTSSTSLAINLNTQVKQVLMADSPIVQGVIQAVDLKTNTITVTSTNDDGTTHQATVSFSSKSLLFTQANHSVQTYQSANTSQLTVGSQILAYSTGTTASAITANAIKITPSINQDLLNNSLFTPHILGGAH